MADDPEMKVLALIRMCSAEQLGVDRGIGVGFSSSIVVAGRYFPSCLMACDHAIMPGCNGEAEFSMIDSAAEPSGIDVGAEIELRYGPLLVAQARVLAVAGPFFGSPR